MLDSSYPYELRTVYELVKGTEIKETHISYVVMTDEYVYKIKKPLDFGFLDYTKAKDRRKFCILEKELNDRFSKNIYLEVLKLCKKGVGEYALEPIESSLYALEYILKMKRIKDDDFLFYKIAKGEITDQMMESVGSSIAKILSSLEKADLESMEDKRSNYDTVRFNATENFMQTEKYIDKFVNKTLFTYIKEKSFAFLDQHKAIFNIRYNDGYVKNGHGDLRLEHIYFNADGTVGLIDCIEFNKRFRYNDIISEAAFLSMELDIGGAKDYADLFLKGFLSIINDSVSLKLLNYYRSYLAYVRAKVIAFMLEGKDESWEFYDQKLSELHKLIDYSAHYISSATDSKTFLFYGLMGTGKTKNAKLFSEQLPVVHISSDEARKKIAGIEITAKMYLDYNNGIYSKESSYDLYAEIAAIANEKKAVGRAVVIDASFSDPKYFDIIKSELKTKFFKVLFTAPDDVIYQRLEARLTDKTVSDGRSAIYEAQKATSIFPKEDLMITTTNKTEENIRKIFVAALD